MYRQILVPLDGSRTAERALPYAAWLARPSGARVHLVHVARPDAEAPAVGAAQAYLNCVARALRVRGVAVATLVVAGEVAPALAGVARAGAADLLVLATHDRRGFDRLAHGSVAAAVLARAPAPVLLVRPGLPPPRALARPGARPRVLVPLDGSAFAAALPAACALADALGGDLVLLRATSPGAGARAAETELRALADQLRTAARTVAVDLREGEPAAAIAAAA
ncbi:MAG TPA: universal stress protein, partial [Thermomicrobiales bacterium]|nr:universal stress protein [Thermomicrobiales bacterium]